MTSFEKKGVISLWLFREPENPADAKKDVLKHFAGVDHYDLDSQEGVVRESQTPIAELLGPLSFSESFRVQAAEAARKVGAPLAYGVLAQYDFEYDPGVFARPVAPDPMFLGTFPWHA
jgi:hypothetical protein